MQLRILAITNEPGTGDRIETDSLKEWGPWTNSTQMENYSRHQQFPTWKLGNDPNKWRTIVAVDLKGMRPKIGKIRKREKAGRMALLPFGGKMMN